MQVLVIGGTNFIGPPVVRSLVEGGHEVTVFHRGRTDNGLPEVKRILGDRKDLASFSKEFERLSPDVVLDMVPMNEWDGQTLMETFGGIAGRVVAISSQDVYRAYDIVRRRHPGPPDPVPLIEDSPLRERLYIYGREGANEYEKILVEKAVMDDLDLPATVLRLPAVYGPGDFQHRLFPYLKRMDDGRPVIPLEKGMSSWRWTHGYVENVADAISLAVKNDRAANRIYNVGEPDPLPWAEWVESIGCATGWDGEIREVPAGFLPNNPMAGANPEQHLVVDTDRIRRELGHTEKISREEALRRTIAWERENPPEDIDPGSFDYAAEDAVLAGL